MFSVSKSVQEAIDLLNVCGSDLLPGFLFAAPELVEQPEKPDEFVSVVGFEEGHFVVVVVLDGFIFHGLFFLFAGFLR